MQLAQWAAKETEQEFIIYNTLCRRVPELEDVLEEVPVDCDCSMAGLVETLLLVFVPSSAVFLKKLCCSA